MVVKSKHLQIASFVGILLFVVLILSSALFKSTVGNIVAISVLAVSTILYFWGRIKRIQEKPDSPALGSDNRPYVIPTRADIFARMQGQGYFWLFLIAIIAVGILVFMGY